MVYLLYIDTSSAICTIALSCDTELVAYKTSTDTRNHASVINIMINDVIAESAISLASIHGIVVCAGPGSYTGLRIGLATAKGLCYVLDKPLFLHNKLTLLCWQQYYDKQEKYNCYAALLIAREKEFFVSAHDNNFKCIIPPQHIIENNLRNLLSVFKNKLIITDASNITLNSLIESEIQIDKNISISLSHWLVYALQQYNCNNSVNLSNSEPFYLKQVYTHK